MYYWHQYHVEQSGWIAMALYLLPALIGYMRGHQDRLAILFLDVLLGWTVLFWVIALIWSGTAVRPRV